MTAHSSGAGTSWNETLDVDQPHGQDYQEWNDIRIGIRKRESQEHGTYADNTVGGIHKPGGSAVLGIDDDTATVVADGTYRGHGLVWDGSVNLWCWTAVKGVTAAPGIAGTADWTILKMHPDKQWGGQDVTWTGAHEFDASVDISGNVTMEGDLTIEGALRLDGSADFSDVFVEGDLTIAGKLVVDGTANFGDDVAFVADISIDGTLAFQDAVLTGDSTFTFDSIAGETGPTFKIFGDWSQRAQDVTYTARTDGQVAITYNGALAGTVWVENPAGVSRIANFGTNDRSGACCVVKGGDTWTARTDPTTTGATVWWLPFGDNT